MYPPNDPPRPSRPKAGLGLVIMMIMTASIMMLLMMMMMMRMRRSWVRCQVCGAPTVAPMTKPAQAANTIIIIITVLIAIIIISISIIIIMVMFYQLDEDGSGVDIIFFKRGLLFEKGH